MGGQVTFHDAMRPDALPSDHRDPLLDLPEEEISASLFPRENEAEILFPNQKCISQTISPELLLQHPLALTQNQRQLFKDLIPEMIPKELGRRNIFHTFSPSLEFSKSSSL